MSELVDRARLEGTPLVEGDSATFVWQGPESPLLLGDFNGWGREPISLAPLEWEVWGTTVTLPRDAYVEYQYRDSSSFILDPLNRHTVPDGLGGRNNYAYMPDARPTQLTRALARVPHGTITRHTVYDDHLIVGGKRTVHLYRPPTHERSPLLVV